MALSHLHFTKLLGQEWEKLDKKQLTLNKSKIYGDCAEKT